MAKPLGEFAKRSRKALLRKYTVRAGLVGEHTRGDTIEMTIVHAVSALSGEPICSIPVPTTSLDVHGVHTEVKQRIAQEMGLGEEGISLLLQGELLGERPLYAQTQVGVVRNVGPAKIMEERHGPTPDTCTFDMCIHEERVYGNVFKLATFALNHRFRVERDDCPHGYRLAEDEEMQTPGFYGNVMHLREGKGVNADLDSTLADVLRLEGSPGAEKKYFTDKGYFTIQDIIDSIIDFERFHYSIIDYRQTNLGTEEGECVDFEFGGLGLNDDGESYHIRWYQ
jgi:hypothetical protein